MCKFLLEREKIDMLECDNIENAHIVYQLHTTLAPTTGVIMDFIVASSKP